MGSRDARKGPVHHVLDDRPVLVATRTRLRGGRRGDDRGRPENDRRVLRQSRVQLSYRRRRSCPFVSAARVLVARDTRGCRRLRKGQKRRKAGGAGCPAWPWL